MKFKNYIETESGIKDTNTSPGTAGQVLSSTVTGTSWIDPDTLVSAASKLVVIACKNVSGAQILKGTPVYQSGTVGATDVIEVEPANATISTGYLPAIGILQTTLNNNGFGNVVITGEFLNYSTADIPTDRPGGDPFTGDTVYLAAGGGLTCIRPTGAGNAIQNLGLIGKVSGGNSGSITVSSIMRANDVPNLPEGRIWIGDGNTIVSDTVYVDEPNSRVGINTATPIYDLDVDGGLRATSWSYFSTDGPTSIAQLGGGTTTTSQFNIISTAAGSSFIAATNTLSIKANNTTAIKIDSAANVGIGTTSPSTKLHVSGGDIRIDDTERIEFGAGGVRINNDAAGRMYYRAPLGFYWETNGGYRMVLNSSGNVGIGTTSPGAKLDVSGGDIRLRSNSTYIRITDSNGSQNRVLGINSSNNMYIGPIDSYQGGGIIYGASANVQYHGFYGGGSEKVRITSSGNVGIGTASPSELLHLSSTGPARLLIEADTDNVTETDNAQIILKQDGGAVVGNLGYKTNTNGLEITNQYVGADGVLTFGTSNAERMRINYLGNVGIGTTSPNHELVVEGGASSPNIELKNTSYSNGGFVLNRANYTQQWKWWAESSIMYFGFSIDESTYSNKLVIKSNGNVGIGTTNPGDKLVVQGDGDGILVRSNDFTLSRIIPRGQTSTNWDKALFSLYNAATENVRIDTAGSSWFNGGSVGIGTTSPSSKLQVNGGVQLAFDGSTPSLAKVGTFRYRKSGNNTYVDMCMQTGASTYAWVNIVTNSW